MNEQIYRDLVVGRLPIIKGKVDTLVQFDALAAVRAASNAMQVDRIHTVISEHENFAYYIAVPSVSLASTPNFATALAASFPAHPDHKGEGVYVHFENGTGMAVLVSGERFEYIYGSSESISEMLDTEGLPIHNVEGFLPWPLHSALGRAQSAGNKFGLLLAKFSAAWLALASIALLGINVALAFVGTTSPADIAGAYSAAASKISTVQPLQVDLAAMGRVTTIALRSGGWVEKYRLDNGKESFTVSMPQWVSKDYTDALGPNVITELNRASGQVIASKTVEVVVKPKKKKSAEPEVDTKEKS